MNSFFMVCISMDVCACVQSHDEIENSKVKDKSSCSSGKDKMRDNSRQQTTANILQQHTSFPRLFSPGHLCRNLLSPSLPSSLSLSLLLLLHLSASQSLSLSLCIYVYIYIHTYTYTYIVCPTFQHAQRTCKHTPRPSRPEMSLLCATHESAIPVYHTYFCNSEVA